VALAFDAVRVQRDLSRPDVDLGCADLLCEPDVHEDLLLEVHGDGDASIIDTDLVDVALEELACGEIARALGSCRLVVMIVQR
jgi:hypothetical protein